MSGHLHGACALAAAPTGTWDGEARAGSALNALLRRCATPSRLVVGDPAVRVLRVTSDSRRVEPGDLFFALPGEKADGALYLREAFARGAVAAVASNAPAARITPPVGRALVASSEPRALCAEAAAALAGNPSEHLTAVAVTGTSGKTTTTYILESIFAAAGHATGVIGTIEYRWSGHRRSAPLTTPDAVELQDLFSRMLEDGVTHVALEASSHALSLERVRATSLDAAIFTNFTRDHLDYHPDLEHYFAAKARLFREILPASGKDSFAVLNADDREVMTLARESTLPVVTFGARADVRCTEVAADASGSRGVLLLGGERVPFTTRLIGAPHLLNIQAAAAAAWRLGIAPGAIVQGIAACAAVPGRLEAVSQGQPFAVVVDYAHKPDALERVLASLRAATAGRLIAVFGCGGDRDAGKRPLMGAIAARLADLVILTSDNPRTEDPVAILAAIERGVRSEGRTPVAQEALGQVGQEAVYVVMPERRAAIARAIEIARDGDLVLIAGKGHEDYQIVGTEKHHLDDREEARAALAARSYRGEGKAESR